MGDGVQHNLSHTLKPEECQNDATSPVDRLRRTSDDLACLNYDQKANQTTNISDDARGIVGDSAELSPETTPPALPPRQIRSKLSAEGLVSKGSLRISKASPRPQLLGRATTALSVTRLQNVANQSIVHERTSPTSIRPISRQPSISKYERFQSRLGLDKDDTASLRSVRSYAPRNETAVEIESLLGEILDDAGATESYSTDLHYGNDSFLRSLEHEDLLFEAQFQREFEEVDQLREDESNEESRILNWRSKLKHFFILSSAGKPIYSRHGDDQLISNSIGVIQTIISFYQGANDVLKGFTAGEARFAILSKGHLHLVAISRLRESDAQLRGQLEALYMQILSTLTLPNMQRMFVSRPSTDLRRPLEGTNSLLSALADSFTRGSPSALLSALECLRMRKSHRQIINDTLVKTRSPNLLYGLVVAGGRLVSVLRPKKHSLHPGDLQLIFNMLFEADGVRAGGGENWIPLCLPAYNNTGYIYMYVSFVSVIPKAESPTIDTSYASTKDHEIAILLISAKKDSFFELQKMRDELVKQLESNGSMSIVRAAVRRGRLSCADIVPGTVLRHFLFKSRANVQFFMPSLRPQFEHPARRRKLISVYGNLQSAAHSKAVHLKVYHATSHDHTSLAWITPLFELYCVANATAGRNALAQAANKIVQWIRREEERVFIIGGAVF